MGSISSIAILRSHPNYLTMKVFIALALISVASAAKLKFTPYTNEFADCGGSKLRIDSLTVDPDPVPVPGQITINAAGEITKEMTGDGLKMALKLAKIKPTHLDVPCVDGLGSCTYDVCTEFIYPGSPACDYFPEGVECKCPLPPTKINLKDLMVDIPDAPSSIDPILKGTFEAEVKLYNEADGIDNPEGCLKGTATLDPSL